MDSDVNRRERAQVGIGTLIVFIAMVLVAAIAAGVLLGTGGTLQSSAEQTGHEATDRVSNRLVVVSAVGHVTGEVKNSGLKSSEDVMPNESVDTVALTVKLSPGSGPVDLSKATVSWLGPESETTLVHGETADRAPGVEDDSDPGTFGLDGDGGSRNGDGGGTDPSQYHKVFNTYAVSGDEHTHLSNQEDRIQIRINAGLVEAETRDAVTKPYADPLDAGSEVTLRITTASGSTTLYRLAVPASLTGAESVSL